MTCSVEGCPRTTRAKGICALHYKRVWRHGDVGLAREPDRLGPCVVAGCEKEKYAKAMCLTHYNRVRKSGDPGPAGSVRPDGRVTDKGYRQITRDGRKIMEHRWVMSQHLGRPLLPTETVHHINGVRLDNRLENLELWSSSQPSGQRVEDKVAWAREILALYGNED